ncbi:hypothetical protein M2271_006936 [Streptomyces sp. LBL]|nr:hypothetical protein [Streptomyces sp. LBL]
MTSGLVCVAISMASSPSCASPMTSTHRSTPGGRANGAPVIRTSTGTPAASTRRASWSSRPRPGVAWWSPAPLLCAFGPFPEHDQHAAHLRHGLVGAACDGVQRLAGRPRIGGEDVSGQAGLDGDRRHVVGDHVVQFTGYSHALGDDGPLGLLLLLQAQLLGEHREPLAALREPTGPVAGHPQDSDHHGHEDHTERADPGLRTANRCQHSRVRHTRINSSSLCRSCRHADGYCQTPGLASAREPRLPPTRRRSPAARPHDHLGRSGRRIRG